MNTIVCKRIDVVGWIKTGLIILIVYSLMEEFYIGPEIGKTLTWMFGYLGLILLSRQKMVIGKYGVAILSMVAVILVNVYLTAITYQVDFFAILLDRRWYFYLLLYFVFADFCRTHKGAKRFLIVLLVATIVMSLLILIQGYLRSYVTTKWFLNEESFLSVNEWRNGRIRLSLCPYIRVATFLYSAVILMLRKRDGLLWLHMLNCVITGAALLLFDSTRMIYLIILITIGAVFLCGIHFENKRFELLIKCGGVCVGVLVILAGIGLEVGIVQNIIHKFSGFTEEGSWYARVEAYQYYLEYAFKNPLMGIGLISESSFSGASRIIHGAQGYFYPSDVGLIGTMGVLGMISGIVYVGMILYLPLTNYKRFGKITMDVNEAIMFMIIMFMPTLSLLDRQRIFMFPICYSICEIALQYGEENGQKK